MTENRISFGDALKEFGWFPLTFASVVGGPSVLSILQTVFVERRLTEAFQWIVDGYDRIMLVLGAILEPLLAPAIAFVRFFIPLDVQLDPIWRPVFALSMVVVIAEVRSSWKLGSFSHGNFYLVFGCLFSLFGSVIAGLAASANGPIAQGLIASAPLAGIMLIDGVGAVTQGDAPQARGALANSLVNGLFAFALAAGLSFLQPLETSAGLLVLMTYSLLLGSLSLTAGLFGAGVGATTFGLSVLGGFATATLIILADIITRTVA